MKILVVVNGRNCAEYVEKCLNSLKEQSFQDFSLIIVDDFSDDKTIYKIANYFKESELMGLNGACLVANISRLGTALCRLKGEEKAKELELEYDVVAWIDMDDYLLPNAFERISKEYEDPDCWLTYGNMLWHSTGKPMFKKDELEPSQNPRYDSWKYIHLRTHRKGLTDHLTNEDILPHVFEAYPDINMLYCMLELASPKHIRVIYEPLYVYRDQHPNTCINQYSFNKRDAEKKLTKTIKPKSPLFKI